MAQNKDISKLAPWGREVLAKLQVLINKARKEGR